MNLSAIINNKHSDLHPYDELLIDRASRRMNMKVVSHVEYAPLPSDRDRPTFVSNSTSALTQRPSRGTSTLSSHSACAFVQQPARQVVNDTYISTTRAINNEIAALKRSIDDNHAVSDDDSIYIGGSIGSPDDIKLTTAPTVNATPLPNKRFKTTSTTHISTSTTDNVLGYHGFNYLVTETLFSLQSNTFNKVALERDISKLLSPSNQHLVVNCANDIICKANNVHDGPFATDMDSRMLLSFQELLPGAKTVIDQHSSDKGRRGYFDVYSAVKRDTVIAVNRTAVYGFNGLGETPHTNNKVSCLNGIEEIASDFNITIRRVPSSLQTSIFEEGFVLRDGNRFIERPPIRDFILECRSLVSIIIKHVKPAATDDRHPVTTHVVDFGAAMSQPKCGNNLWVETDDEFIALPHFKVGFANMIGASLKRRPRLVTALSNLILHLQQTLFEHTKDEVAGDELRQQLLSLLLENYGDCFTEDFRRLNTFEYAAIILKEEVDDKNDSDTDECMGVDVGAPSYEDDDYEDSSIATNNDDSTYYDSEEELDDDDDYEEVDIDMPELVDSPHYSSSYQKKMDKWNKNTLALHMDYLNDRRKGYTQSVIFWHLIEYNGKKYRLSIVCTYRKHCGKSLERIRQHLGNRVTIGEIKQRLWVGSSKVLGLTREKKNHPWRRM